MTLDIIEKHSDLPWDFTYVSNNPNITMNFIEKHKDKDWNWSNISRTICLSIELIKTYNNKPFSYWWMSINPSMTTDILLEFPNRKWCWESLSEHKNISIDFIESHPEFPWITLSISRNPNITYQYINNIKQTNPIILNAVIDEILYSKYGINIPLSDLKIKSENYDEIIKLCTNKYINYEFILSHPELPWNYCLISMRASLHDFQSYTEFPWCTIGLLQNPNIPIDYNKLKTNNDYYWLSKNPNINLDYISENIDKHWSFNDLCKNKYKFQIYKVKSLDKEFQTKTKLPTDIMGYIGSFL
jgi:uncharacterized protein with HEPN domain